ncbi:MAG: N-acetylglucosamine kinase [Eubacteriales bacterium]
MKKYVIAIDGGGTKTVGVLADMNANIISYKVKGAANPNDIGEAAAGELLGKIVRELADSEDAWIDSVYAGVSGAVGHEDALAAAISKECPDTKIRVASDIYNLFGLLDDPDADAAALICGTGSACFVRKDGVLHRIGGWGYLLDTNGGAYSVGRDGLEAALRMADGRGEQTALYLRACEYLGDKPENSICKIYSLGKTLIAGFAPAVFEEAQKGDAVAIALANKAFSGIDEMIAQAVKLIGDDPTVIVGGGMSNAQAFRAHIMSMEGIKAVCPLKDQIHGAIRCAIILSNQE